MKVSVSLGLTLCTDEDKRNFARFGFDLMDLDVAGDIESQAREGVSAILTALAVANDGMEDAVSTALSDLSSVEPSGVREEMDKLQKTVDRISGKLIPNIVAKVKELDDKVTGGKEEDEGAE